MASALLRSLSAPTTPGVFSQGRLSALRHRSRLELSHLIRGPESYKVDFDPKPFVTMDLPDESQWDETACNLAACQHPQCWAAIRRMERGHPRILRSSYKTSLDVNEKLPVLTIVNLSDSCFQAWRRPHSPLPGLTYTKPHSLLSPRSKFDSKFQGRPRKDLPDKDLTNYTNRFPEGSHKLRKLPVLNLNETQIPPPQDVSNMVVVWIPKEPGAYVSPALQYIVSSRDEKKEKKTSAVSSVVLSGKQDREAKLRARGILAPPPTPEHVFEQMSSEFLPFLNQSDTVPQELLNDLVLDEGERSPCLEMKTQLATRKKKPLKKSRPESVISGQMFLSVHRLTLQRPSLKYPAHLKKLYYSLDIEDRVSRADRSPGLQKQKQRKVKTPTKKPEAKKKSKKDPGSQSTAHEALGDKTLPSGESDNNQQLQMEMNGPILKQDSTERPQTGNAENDLDSFSSKQNLELSKTGSTNKDFSTQMEEVPVAQEETSEDLSSRISRASWNPEFKILRIFESPDYEAEENQLSGLPSEMSSET